MTRARNEKARKEFLRKREINRGFDDTPVLPITRDALEAALWSLPGSAREAKLMELIRDTWGFIWKDE